MQSQSPWIPAPASKGGGRGQGTAREAPQRPPGAGGCGQGVGEASEVRPVGKYLEPLARGTPPRGGPAPASRPRRGGRRKTKTRRGHPEEWPALPAPRPQLVRPGLDLRSLKRVAVGRKRGCFLEGEQRLQAWVGPLYRPSNNQCPRHDIGPWKPRGSLEAADGALQGLLRRFPDDIISVPCFLFDANHTLGFKTA